MSSMFVDTEAPSLESGTWSAGAGIVDSARATANAVQSGDWGDLAASGGVLALDGLLLAIDPVGSALAAGVGWLMEHLAPLRELLDFVAGDPNAIKEGADTWLAIKEDLQQLADELPGQAEQQTAEWSGQAKDAYSRQVKEYTDGLQALSISAGSASATIATAGTMVATTRGIIRDIIAAIVAELIKGALAALAGSVVSFGATVAGYLAYAAGRIGMTIAKITSKISALLAKLGKAGALMARALDDMAKVGSKIGADLVTSGAKVFPASPALGGATHAAGRMATAGANGMEAVAPGVTRAADGLTSAAGRTADAATGLTRGSENLAGTGLRWMNGADDAGRSVAEGVGRRAQDWVQGTGYQGRYADDINQWTNVVKPESAMTRGALGAEQYHEQNYDGDSGSYYDGYNGSGQYTGEHGRDGYRDAPRPE
ncbi:hypothetical protein F1721_15920 [Saccharopolyspora hirsuta]|uniref:Outer membrane channel protein CpnT-like N-terminal domain-containing protein n=1 Tax=Saccharopolyspora hirsuta TaxID=1837 RepID=A0A5M7BSY7_SACHI|nr:hypothetical protein [Saccharopolyspora hirsuta]KAA5832493.1 hypothetical protein F1721_15920 [Saccharopolyspora hirsuta]